MNRITVLNRRDFLRLIFAAGGAVVLTPLVDACGTTLTPPITTPQPSPVTKILTDPTLTPEADLLADLRGLDIDSFFQQSYRRWLIRDPESLTSQGLADFYGVGDSSLTDISDAFIRETQMLESGTLDLLRTYDSAAFSNSQAITAKVYDWFLDDLKRGHVYMYYDYVVNPIITSVHYNLYVLFTLYHPLNNLQDGEDYISRLSKVGGKIDALVDGLKRREENGVVLPAFMNSLVLSDLTSLAGGSPAAHDYYTSFKERHKGVSPEESKTLLTQVEKQVKETVIPAYQKLSDFFRSQRSKSKDAVGVWQFDASGDYYAQSLRRQTTTDMTADEIHELGLQHVERVHTEMRTLFSGLGYSSEESIPNLYDSLTADSGVYNGQEAVDAYQAVIASVKPHLSEAFASLPVTDVTVVGGTEGDYYVPAPYDGSRPGIFYARTTGGTPKFGVKSLAFHETIPGHHLQISIAQEIPNLPDLRRGMQFNAYTEGWGLYAERLMWELGAYSEDPQGDLGRLRMEAFRAARLVVDTGIHARKWSFDKAVNYLAEAAGFTQNYAQREITRYSVWPGQATSYYLGFLKILSLRQLAKDELGDRFDLKLFHRVVLENGSVPLSILEQLVRNMIAA